ncbi:D-lyxose/D-mannose family sugar isomerase [Thalassococcus sp. S3]|uniref:D-lyxose/D-mannose family sugar isomerase n=1 Tax=Thalassococcus sp. S3 TaxID=2017482 RepID=UPI00102427E2|nr:D-lyxose/D-mannose family sugar isomerase [Thalassococcus sp. S3]QBF30545.1 D-lyxose/D-mannose family sugar isomerase [Thalassococcus sp. S3]
MKRSTINHILAESEAFISTFGYVLPPFAFWSPEEMRAKRPHRVLERALGWDVTDYDQGRFDDLGLVLFTVRNGLASDLGQARGMLYAEKIMISGVKQICPMHRHNVKAEDIINRGGGSLVLHLFASGPDGDIDDTSPVTVDVDAERRTLPAGSHLSLQPGESVTLLPGTWHAFWAEGTDVLVGEVSTVNDDLTDNVFEDPIGRFSDIDEDVPPRRLLVSDYQTSML